MRRFLVALGVLALSIAPAAHAQLESKPATDGGASFLSGEPEIREGEFAAYEPFVRIPQSITRTGRLTRDLIGDAGYFSRDQVIAPAGTAVFAVPFTAQTRTMGGTVLSSANIVMWCGVLTGPSELLNGGDGFCIVPEEEPATNLGQIALRGSSRIHATGQTPEYRRQLGPSSPYYPHNLGVGARLRAGIDIAEEPIAFPAALSMEIALDTWDERGERPDYVWIASLGSDGQRRTLLDQNRITPGPDGAVQMSIGGVPLRIERIGENRIRVTRVNPPTALPAN